MTLNEIHYWIDVITCFPLACGGLQLLRNNESLHELSIVSVIGIKIIIVSAMLGVSSFMFSWIIPESRDIITLASGPGINTGMILMMAGFTTSLKLKCPLLCVFDIKRRK
jgi:hypothetical protein